MATGSAALPMNHAYRLDDAITKVEGRLFATGTQALVRMLVMQRLADRREGINSAGFVSGYRGSPLAGLDMELWRAKGALAEHDIRFLPGVNEDLAATAVAGTQRVGTDPQAKVDGVFAMWYGKGPGVDRAGDAIRHGHAAGTSDKGGVLLIVGDDHAATSSSIPNASDLSLIGWNLPIIHPASVDEYVQFGLWGWAASRFSGAWVAFKAVSETVESSRSFSDFALPQFVEPGGYVMPLGGLGYGTKDFLTPLIEVRMTERLTAFAAFARANPLDRMEVAPQHADAGIVTVGKNALDVLELLERCGLDREHLAEKGVRIWRPGVVYPLSRGGLATFTRGLKHILVVEEKAGTVESQIKDLLFNMAAGERPSVSGRTGLDGAPLISALGQHRPSSLAPAVLRWLAAVRPDLDFTNQLQAFARPPVLSNAADGMRRLPYFCSGCPHNSSTKVPENSKALAGVGCHYMASWMDRETSGLTQMGGEGADWVGQAAFTKQPHVFQNMGEGTYFHSGLLAIRQAIASGANITYKILFNDAVAMTGGQPVDGLISVPQIVRQMASEGASRIVVVTDEPARYAGIALESGTAVRDRRDLDMVQSELREIEGVTVLIYDQTCAAEKRRRRKRGAFPDPNRRIIINSDVCEGCGDCGKASNCLSIVPLETELGRKRAIDQSSCNKDFSCVEGFCPSFVSVVGGRLKTRKAGGQDWIALAKALPAPDVPVLGTRPHDVLVCGVGGAGIITAGAVIAMAAHLDGLEVAELDFTALAQKGGSVMCHLRMARPGGAINQPRIDWSQANAMIMSDLIVGCLPDNLAVINRGKTRVLVNTHVGSTAEFTRSPDSDPRVSELLAKVRHAASDDHVTAFNANAIAIEHFGEAIGVNTLLVGYAWQMGYLPISEAALMQAVTLNGVAIEANKQAFACGRVLAARGLQQQEPRTGELLRFQRLSDIVDSRAALLAEYQDAAYAEVYRSFVERCAEAERAAIGEGTTGPFAKAVALSLHKLMAYKDEYEVARLYSRPEFMASLHEQFEGDISLRFHLAPPFLARPRRGQSVPQKITFGPWMLHAFAILARLKRLRGTALDLFGYTSERRMERQLIADYKTTIAQLLPALSPRTLPTAIRIAALPETMRGFGHVKRANVEGAKREEKHLLDEVHKLAQAGASTTLHVA